MLVTQYALGTLVTCFVTSKLATDTGLDTIARDFVFAWFGGVAPGR